MKNLLFHVKHLILSVSLITLTKYSHSQYSTVLLEDISIKITPKQDNFITKWNESQKGYNNLSDDLKQLLYWTNYSRKDPKRFWDSIVTPILIMFPQLKAGKYSESLKADLYNSKPLPLLRLNDTLNQTATFHAIDVGLKQGRFSHNSTNGITFPQRFKMARLKNFGAENISLGRGNMLLSLVLLYLDYGLENPGHRKTLLNPDYSDIGLGISMYGSSGSIFFVQDFSSPQ